MKLEQIIVTHKNTNIISLSSYLTQGFRFAAMGDVSVSDKFGDSGFDVLIMDLDRLLLNVPINFGINLR